MNRIFSVAAVAVGSADRLEEGEPIRARVARVHKDGLEGCSFGVDPHGHTGGPNDHLHVFPGGVGVLEVVLLVGGAL